MQYPELPNLQALVEQMNEYTKLKVEYGAQGCEGHMWQAKQQLEAILEQIKQCPIDPELMANEPDELAQIRALRPAGPRRMWQELDEEVYHEKLAGAFLARIIGCTLGAPVEFYSVEHMARWAAYSGDAFPPVDYWSMVKYPNDLRYEKSDFLAYTKEGMNKVPVDDDLCYTILGLLLVEEHGHAFSTEQVGETWKKYLPYACTAEAIALDNLNKGIAANEVADHDNPYCQWIGADIRSDAFAYMAPGYPEKAAEMAYYDAYLSHRRNGIYGEMFFAAAQSAAFACESVKEALEIGLSEIPAQCTLAKDIRWALSIAHTVRDYEQARRVVEERFGVMSHAHTNNNACLSVFGLLIGEQDVTKVLSETVAMGMDNDCTAATAGSIVGAIVGEKGIEPHWIAPFHNTLDTYLIGVGEVHIDAVLARFAKQAKALFEKKGHR